MSAKNYDRLAACFALCKEEERAALIGFLTGGDPDLDTSRRALHALAKEVDILEIGMPFSDPMADGPVIQAASERALKAGTRMQDVFALCAEIRAEHADLGIVLMGYGNTPYVMGYARFAERAQAAGADGVLIVDIPSEESAEFDHIMHAHSLHTIRLLSPTSSEARIELAAASASGFIYYVSLTGITGAAMGALDQVRQQVETIRRHTELPICVGFGIKSQQQAAAVAEFADGVVVGSHFVTQLTTANSAEERLAALAFAARSMREAITGGVA